jgi:hypothetical protein
MSSAGLKSAVLLAFFLAASPSLPAQPLPPAETIFVIMMENTTWPDIKDSPNAPFINNTLLPIAAHCEFYNNLPDIHPSLPNYLWLEAGTNFGILDDAEPADNHQNTTNHLVSLLHRAGISWRAYQENISGTALPLETCCGYSARHNPFIYFDDVTGTNDPNCPYGLAHIRPYSELEADLANNTVARYNFIIPCDCNDMHTACPPLYNPILQGDLWLSNQVPKILNSRAYSNGGLLFIAWDETDSVETRIPLIAMSPWVRTGGYSNTNYYDHSSLLRTLQEIFGVMPLLGSAANATNLGDLFTPFGFTRIEKLPAGATRLTLGGLKPGRTVVLEASADLTTWDPIHTNVVADYSMIFTDNAAPNFNRRFYRFAEQR